MLGSGACPPGLTTYCKGDGSPYAATGPLTKPLAAPKLRRSEGIWDAKRLSLQHFRHLCNTLFTAGDGQGAETRRHGWSGEVVMPAKQLSPEETRLQAYKAG